MNIGPVHQALKPICWLIGKWKSISALVQYPTMKSFNYCEAMEFVSVGQPILNYKSATWHSETKNPIHLEAGFMRIRPDTNQVAFMVGHNLGVTTVEEGTVNDKCITLRSTAIGRMCFVKDPAVMEVMRIYKYYCDKKQLEMVLFMATCNTCLCEHLRVTYEKK